MMHKKKKLQLSERKSFENWEKQKKKILWWFLWGKFADWDGKDGKNFEVGRVQGEYWGTGSKSNHNWQVDQKQRFEISI